MPKWSKFGERFTRRTGARALAGWVRAHSTLQYNAIPTSHVRGVQIMNSRARARAVNNAQQPKDPRLIAAIRYEDIMHGAAEKHESQVNAPGRGSNFCRVKFFASTAFPYRTDRIARTQAQKHCVKKYRG